ncbi:FKBP-type peptidyl-prolyl cis-trans isomerase [bacterium]|nr:FKBP-type peptidyl-prolyl cis-trans isomerase [bacterium]MCI0679713.1 FKBP-type peptidyl-prolyl cis-trans isomerase [bacterium]
MDSSEIKIEVIAPHSTGSPVTADKVVTVHYKGMFLDGKEFDATTPDDPFVFPLGENKVKPGFEQAILGMRLGGRIRATIPSYLMYGEKGAGNVIPPNTTLVFEVYLIGVRSKKRKNMLEN